MLRSLYINVSILLLWATIAGAQSAENVQLLWNYRQGATGVSFNVYKQTNCTGAFVRENTTPIPVTTTNFLSINLTVGQQYCWHVKAVGSDGKESAASNVVSFRVLPTPEAPTDLRAIVAN